MYGIRIGKRRGYTLSEMLVVLGVLVMVAALAQPALRSALGDSRLRSAARRVRAELAKTRLRAMQSGQAQRFRYQPGAGRFEVAPADYDAETERSEPAVEHETAAGGDTEKLPTPGKKVVEQELPEGVAFVDAEEMLSAAPPVDEEGWSEPIVFYPNGRTADARIRLRGERDAVVDLSLRGLTGVATVGKPRHEEAEP
ncbi:MAG: prepilin-type N-terminal cleavage/methylation domain-containing protein [Planctomycetota bacterium]|nr:MAG: prepilin-type N-terminal cleavage/methylation domain-containing protein [Planctomycetota bacterium]